MVYDAAHAISADRPEAFTEVVVDFLERHEAFVISRTATVIHPVGVKKDGRRESFARNKILAGLKKACEKRPISIGTIEAVTDRIEKRIQEMGETEIQSRVVGEEVMKELHQLDQVAYVRFASVYREFKGIDQFMDELQTLAQHRRES